MAAAVGKVYVEKKSDRRFTLKRNNKATNPANVRKRKREENSQKKDPWQRGGPDRGPPEPRSSSDFKDFPSSTHNRSPPRPHV